MKTAIALLFSVFFAMSAHAADVALSSKSTKTSPVGADSVAAIDSEDSNAVVRIPLTNLAAYVLTDTVADFASLSVGGTAAVAVTPSASTVIGFDGSGNPTTYGSGDTLPFAVGIDASGFSGNLATTDDTLQELADAVDGLTVSGFALDTFPTYEDSAHSSGFAVSDTTLAVYSASAGKWLTVALTDSLDPTPTSYGFSVDIVDGNATDYITYDSTQYTDDFSDSGLTADITIVGTPDTGRTMECAGTGVTDNGSYSYTLGTASADVSAVCTFAAAAAIVDDDFSADTSDDYGYITYDSLTVTAGYATELNSWRVSMFYHEQSLGSANHIVEADITPGTSTSVGAGVVFGCDGNGTASTGYRARPGTATAVLTVQSFSGATATFVGNINYTGSHTWTAGATHKIRITRNGNSIDAAIDWNDDGDFDDANEDDMTALTSSTYTAGTHVGIYFDTSADTRDERVDNLYGEAL